MLEDAMAEQVLMGRFKAGDVITTRLEGDTVVFDKSAMVKKPEEKTDGKDGEKAEKVKSEKVSKSSKKSADGDGEKTEESSNN